MKPVLLRKLGDDDVPACIALARTAGWQTDAARWRMMFAVGEPLGIESAGGELVGTVIVNRSPVAHSTRASVERTQSARLRSG